jgi:hypothetical protein
MTNTEFLNAKQRAWRDKKVVEDFRAYAKKSEEERKELLEALKAFAAVKPSECPRCMEGDDEHPDSLCWMHIAARAAIANAEGKS